MARTGRHGTIRRGKARPSQVGQARQGLAWLDKAQFGRLVAASQSKSTAWTEQGEAGKARRGKARHKLGMAWQERRGKA
jgi:hypothetical protein